MARRLLFVTAMKFSVVPFLFSVLLAASPAQDETLRVLVRRAQAAEQQNRLDDAVSLYNQILQIRPGWAAAELNLGLVYHSRGDFARAIRTLSNALRHQPDLHSALLFRGSSYQQTNRPEEAIRDVEKYLRGRPDDPEALPILAGAYLARGDPGRAALAFAALARVTRDPGAYFRLSDCYAQLAAGVLRQLTGEAGGAFQSALTAAGEPACRVDGNSELTAIRCGAARDEFESATSKLSALLAQPVATPADAARLGETIILLARFAAARVLSLAPDSGWAALVRARSAEQAGQTEAANAEYRRAVDAPAATAEMYVRYGQFQCKHDRLDEGLASYERALHLEPSRSDVMGLVGEVHVLRNRPQNAVPYLRKALQANPRDARIRLYLAQALNRTGKPVQAIQVLEAAPEDRDGRIHYVLGRTYEQQGQPDKARQAMDVFRQRRNPATQ